MASRIFLDSDVIVSSLISSSGAAYFLINKTQDLETYISNLSLKELEVVMKRLSIDKTRLLKTVSKCKKVDLKWSNEDLKKEYQDYVFDTNDAHIVAGSRKTKVAFLISYNLRDYNLNKIKQDFGIIVLTPAQFLQYLRSL